MCIDKTEKLFLFGDWEDHKGSILRIFISKCSGDHCEKD